MTDPSFDPYHHWLGIPPKHQPPDYYRLLALERFEAAATKTLIQFRNADVFELDPHWLAGVEL
jgi:hypothetical protein